MPGKAGERDVADRGARSKRLYRLSVAYPMGIPLALMGVAVIPRIVDILCLPLAEAWGEAFLHKALGFALVLAYVWAAGQSLRAIGLHGRGVGRAMWIGGSGIAAVFVAGFGRQWLVSRAAGAEPRLIFAAIDPQTGLGGGLPFALWLFAANLVNSFMEEGLFRGIMLSHFRVRLTPWKANLLQAALFGLWHLAWPTQRLLTGQVDLATAASQAATVVLGSTISGLAYGTLYLQTDSLWAPWLAHTINNSIFNLVHIRTVEGLDADVGVLYGVIAVGYLALLLWTRAWARRWQMRQVRPCDVAEGGELTWMERQ
ncbi:MAG: CPBP family intramembrane metalloprotease [Anaerolineae bacterium]|nr:CPBP family intramembrane metalloprotease [Anaerolineae bacterium]